ncbi:GNAT family N-acetyltransferase [Saccharospirillum sp. HFRX-1]|uniref:GNAT family N-acetyltransferase n=1 Tax=unclassified Saccharospirillum TaxID=2633430 RepID=UPI0037119D9F
MQPSLELLGRFDEQRVRQRLLSTFQPDDTQKIFYQDKLVGFYVLLDKVDHLYLDHFYIDPEFQGLGIGGVVITEIKKLAQQKQQPIRLGALKGSDSNKFYRRHGFQQTHESDFDIYYQLEAPTNTVEIKLAQASDIATIRDCAEQAFAQYIEAIGKRPAPMDADFDNQISKQQIFIARYQSQFAGYVACYPDGNALHLDAIAVLPAFTGRGIGKRLIGYVEDKAKAEGFQVVELFTNEKMTNNLSLYPSLGYQETDRRLDSGYQRVFFRKPV